MNLQKDDVSGRHFHNFVGKGWLIYECDIRLKLKNFTMPSKVFKEYLQLGKKLKQMPSADIFKVNSLKKNYEF